MNGSLVTALEKLSLFVLVCNLSGGGRKINKERAV
jgi:hypothetical protein